MDSPAREHRKQGPEKLRFSILTVSSSREVATDDSGRLAAESIEGEGHTIVGRRVVPDGTAPVREAVAAWIEAAESDVLIVTGGTGFSPGDLTPEAVIPLFERPIDGFGELFRRLSFDEIGSAAMLSRSCAGTIGNRAVFLLPGSPAAVSLGLRRLILPEVRHLVGQLRRVN